MICKNCGNEVEGKFCSVCGTPVEEVAPVVPEQAVPAPEAPAAPAPEAPAAPAAPAYNYAPQQPPVVPTAPVPTVDPGKTMGTVALILGIIALAFGTICSCLFACLGGIVPLGCGIAGIIVGSQAKKKSQAAGFKNTSAQVGMILSIVAVVIVVIFIILNAVLGGLLAASEFSYYY